MLWEMVIKTEDENGKFTTDRRLVTTEDISRDREHFRSTAPRGCTRTIEVRNCTY